MFMNNTLTKELQLIYNHTIDLCRYIKKKKGSDKIFRFMYDSVKPYGNLPNKCPLPIGFYYIKNYSIDEKMFPRFISLPDARAMLPTDFYISENKHQIKVLATKWWVQIKNV